MKSTSHRSAHLRYLAAAVAGCAALATASAATASAAGSDSRSAPRAIARGSSANAASEDTISLVAHETQSNFINQGGLGDEAIFRGILDNSSDTRQVGIFAGTLTSVSSDDSLNLATVDLQLPGGQITVQGFFDGNQTRIVHAVTGGTGIYRGVRGEFSFTEPSRGVLDITVTLQ